MLYDTYQVHSDVLAPIRLMAEFFRGVLTQPWPLIENAPLVRSAAAAMELLSNAGMSHDRPEFGIRKVTVDGEDVGVTEEVVASHPFCRLLHFRKEETRDEPTVLVVAPLSGHFSTLLRGTVATLLPDHNVYITDWVNARNIPLLYGRFDLDDFVDVVSRFVRLLGPKIHLMAVCQPSVPVLAAVARMETNGDPYVPHSMVLMGGPIDTRVNPTVVNTLAERRGTDWFRRNVITKVPFPNPGFMRDVYPGFLQLHGFVSMNLDRHMDAHSNLFVHLVKGDGDSVQKHREFYDEYLAVMDLTAEFYLQTVDTAFLRHALPKGEMMHRDRLVDPGQIRRVALLTVEGEHDDISGVGQTEAAHRLCVNLPPERQAHWLQPGVGHYGVFNGSRFRAEIAPRIADFILSMSQNARARSTASAAAGRGGGSGRATVKA